MEVRLEYSFPGWLNSQIHGYGGLAVLKAFYMKDLSIHRFWYPQESWNQFPADTEAWLYKNAVCMDSNQYLFCVEPLF